MNRTFCISMETPEAAPLVCEESDTFGIIGAILTLVSQLDLDESVVITCIDQEE